MRARMTHPALPCRPGQPRQGRGLCAPGWRRLPCPAGQAIPTSASLALRSFSASRSACRVPQAENNSFWLLSLSSAASWAEY